MWPVLVYPLQLNKSNLTTVKQVPEILLGQLLGLNLQYSVFPLVVQAYSQKIKVPALALGIGESLETSMVMNNMTP